MKILLSNNPSRLEEALAEFSQTGSVEAEYGERVVRGSEITLAHHGSRSGNLCPCLYDNSDKVKDLDAIGISHLDLDTLGGVLALMGEKPSPNSFFWEVAAAVDTKGVHKLSEILEEIFPDEREREHVSQMLHAYWAWAEANKVFPPREGDILDVSNQIEISLKNLRLILGKDRDLLQAGKEWAKQKEELNVNSFCEISQGVLFRVANSFVNHLYVTPEGKVGRAVVSFMVNSGSITVSLANPEEEDVSCVKLMQENFGPLAGGHKGIAGGDRKLRYGIQDALNIFDQICHLLNPTP